MKIKIHIIGILKRHLLSLENIIQALGSNLWKYSCTLNDLYS